MCCISMKKFLMEKAMGWGFGRKGRTPTASDALKRQHASGVYEITDISGTPAWADPDKKLPMTQKQICQSWGKVKDYKGPKNCM